MEKNTNKQTYYNLGSLFAPKYNTNASLEGYIQVSDPEKAKAVAELILSGEKVYLSMWENKPKKANAKVDKYFALSLGSVMSKR